uniref:RING-type domain-containing protein n=1 Tax=Acrobeloides nanus TaxID=290746 RepID=A0A914D8M7_9BILA
MSIKSTSISIETLKQTSEITNKQMCNKNQTLGSKQPSSISSVEISTTVNSNATTLESALNSEKEYKKLNWFGFMNFYITQHSLKEMFQMNQTFTLNLLFLNRFDRLPRLGLSAYSPIEIYMKDMPRIGIEQGHVPYAKTLRYTNKDPQWTHGPFNKYDSVQFIFTLRKYKIEFSYAKDGVRSPVYEYVLPPNKFNAHLILFIMKPMRHMIRVLTDPDYLSLKLKEVEDVLPDKKGIYGKQEKQDWECKVCFDKTIDRALVPCGHCFCHCCVEQMENNIFGPRECPICMTRITDKSPIHKTTNHCLFCAGDHLSQICTKLNTIAVPCGCLVGCTESVYKQKQMIKCCASCNLLVKYYLKVFI